MRIPALVCLGLTACQGNIVMTPQTPEPAPMTVVTGAPLTVASPPARNTAGTWVAPSSLWSTGGNITIVDGPAVKQFVDTDFVTITVGIDGESHELGTVKAVSRRGEGVLLATTNGLFHDAPGYLLASPASASVSMATVRFIDSFDDTLYVSSVAELSKLSDSTRQTLVIADDKESGEVQAVIGRTPSSAIVVKGASLYAIDFTAKKVTTLARGLASVTAIDRNAEGVLIGTTEGLVEVHADDSVTRRTFTVDTSTPVTIVDLDVSNGTTTVVTDSAVLELSSTGSTVLTTLARAWPDAFARDGAHDAWVIDGAQVIKLGTSLTQPPPSFATEVKPFMQAHCATCHATGARYAPVEDFTSLALARQKANAIIDRITESDLGRVMPPPDTEVLTAAQYDVVVRWVAGGMLP